MSKLIHFVRTYGVIIITILLFIVPLVFWFPNDKAHIGGDDSRLYLYSPADWRENFAKWSYVSFSGLGSYHPQHFYLPITYISSGIQYVAGQNLLQPIWYGLIISSSFIGVFLCIREVFYKEKLNTHGIVIGSLLYILFPLSYLTFWHEPFKFIFALPVYPFLLYLFLKSLNTKNVIYILIAGLISGLFSVSISSVPFIYPFVIGAGIFLLFYFYSYKEKKRFLYYFILLGILTIFLNLFWLIPFISAALIGGDLVQAVTSETTIQNSINSIVDRSEEMNIVDTLFGLPSRAFMESSKLWFPVEHLTSYLYKIGYLNVIFPLIIIVSFIFSSKKYHYKLYTLAFVFLIFTFFHTVNLGDWGVALFSFMTKNIPGFVSMRNFQNKVTLTYLLFYSFIFSISFTIVLHKIRSKYLHNGLIIFIYTLLFLQGLPFILGAVNRIPIHPESQINRLLKIPDNYRKVIQFFASSQQEQRVLNVPFSIGTWSVVFGEDKKGVYIGTPLLQSILDISEFSGRSSFNNHFIPDFSSFVEENMLQNNFNEMFYLLGYLGVDKIVYSKDIYSRQVEEEVRQKYLWLHNSGFSEEYYDLLVSELEETERFGPYTIYEIPEEYVQPIFYIPSTEIYTNDISNIDYVSDHIENSIINRETDQYFFKKSEYSLNKIFLKSFDCIACIPNDLEKIVLPQIQILPDSFLYSLTERVEKKPIYTGKNVGQEVDLALGMSNKRLAELIKMMTRNTEPEYIDKNFEEINRNLDIVKQHVVNMSEVSNVNNQIIHRIRSYTTFNIRTINDFITSTHLSSENETKIKTLIIKNQEIEKIATNKEWISNSEYMRFILDIPEKENYTLIIEGIDLSDGAREVIINDRVKFRSFVNGNNEIEIENVEFSRGINTLEIERNSDGEMINSLQPIEDGEKVSYKLPVEDNEDYRFGVNLSSTEEREVSYKIVDTKNNDLLKEGKFQINKDSQDYETFFSTNLSSNIVEVQLENYEDVIYGSLNMSEVSNPVLTVMHRSISDGIGTTASVNFTKVNPTHWELTLVNQPSKPFLLVYLDTFHQGWMLTDSSGFYNRNHVLSNMYANAWVINPEEKSNNSRYRLEFEPQFLFYKSAFASIIVFCVVLLYLGYRFIKYFYEREKTSK